MERITATLIFLAFSPAALACDQNMIIIAADDMRRLGLARTLDDAQTRARRARASVEQAEISIMSCCLLASLSLSDTARSLRRVETAGSALEAEGEITRAFRRFNEAVENWNNRLC